MLRLVFNDAVVLPCDSLDAGGDTSSAAGKVTRVRALLIVARVGHGVGIALAGALTAAATRREAEVGRLAHACVCLGRPGVALSDTHDNEQRSDGLNDEMSVS